MDKESRQMKSDRIEETISVLSMIDELLIESDKDYISLSGIARHGLHLCLESAVKTLEDASHTIREA